MSLVVNLMKEADINDVLNISSLSFSVSWSRDSYIKELSNPLAKYFIAKIDNTIVGFAGTWIILDEAHITNIAIHPDYRRQGIASKILESLLSYCRNHGCIAYTLEVRESNEAAKTLYKKFNFKESGIRKGYYEDTKENAILMWLKE